MMTEDTQELVKAWIERFGEPPSIVDEDLMRELLDEQDAPFG